MLSPYDRLIWNDEQVEHWLVHDEHKRELIAWFGHANWLELTALAKRAHAAAAQRHASPAGFARAEAHRIWVIPGIMGTQLGRERPDGHPPDVLWLDPVDFSQGRLPELAWRGADDDLRTFGPLLHNLLHLKLRLSIAGFAPRFFAYDWRAPIAASAARFAAALRRDAQPCSIVAHSMGGLLVRQALAANSGAAHEAALPTIDRIVQLGTPNHGAFAAVQALRGTYAVVRRLAMLDASRSAEELAQRVFATLPSLHDLLPFGSFASEDCDWHDAAHWPSDAMPALAAGCSEDSRRFKQGLPEPDLRFRIVAGYGFPTVGAAQRGPRGFHYRLTEFGDGTVALRSARIAALPLWLVRCAHGDLPRDALVARAVVELLDRGETSVLQRLAPDEPGPEELSGASTEREIDDASLQLTLCEKLDWNAMSIDARREFLERLNEPVWQ